MSRPDPAAPLWLPAAPILFLLFWSSGFPVAKLGLEYTGPMTLIVLRFALVVLVLAPLLLIIRPPWPRGRALRDVIRVGLFIHVFYFGLSYQAMALAIPSSTIALIATLQPLLIGVLAPRLAGERVAALRWVGLLTGFAGASLVILTQTTQSGLSLPAVALALCSLLGLTAGTLYEKRHPSGAHPVSANIIQFGMASIILSPAALFLEGFAVDLQPGFLLALTYLATANSIVSLGLLFLMIRHGEVSAVSSLFFLVPPLAALIAWWLIDETLHPWSMVGMLLAVLGVALASRSPAKPSGTAERQR